MHLLVYLIIIFIINTVYELIDSFEFEFLGLHTVAHGLNSVGESSIYEEISGPRNFPLTKTNYIHISTNLSLLFYYIFARLGGIK